MTATDLDRMAQEFNKNMRPWIEDVIKRELDHRVHAMKMAILADLTEDTIRTMIRDTVKGRVDVTVVVK